MLPKLQALAGPQLDSKRLALTALNTGKGSAQKPVGAVCSARVSPLPPAKAMRLTLLFPHALSELARHCLVAHAHEMHGARKASALILTSFPRFLQALPSSVHKASQGRLAPPGQRTDLIHSQRLGRRGQAQ